MLSQPLPHLRFNFFVISESGHQGGVLADQTDEVASPGCKADVQEVPSVVLESAPGVRHCHDEAIPLLPVSLDIFYELHPEASTELHSTMQNSYVHHASETGLTVLPENPKTR
jgi:hypothetical protein